MHIKWFAEDALKFDLNLDRLEGLAGSVVCGNIVLADQGRTIDYSLSSEEAGEDGIAVGGSNDSGVLMDDGPGQRFRLRLDCQELVYARPFDLEAARFQPATGIFNQVEKAMPGVFLMAEGQRWNPVQDLLRSDRFATDFRVEPRERGGLIYCSVMELLVAPLIRKPLLKRSFVMDRVFPIYRMTVSGILSALIIH